MGNIGRFALTAGLVLAALAMWVPSASAAEAGSIDTSFGQAGFYTSDPSVDSTLQDIAIAPNGKIAIARRIESRRTVATRLTAEGQLDRAFGINGSLSPVAASGIQGDAAQIAIRPDGATVTLVSSTVGGCEYVVKVGEGNSRIELPAYFDCDQVIEQLAADGEGRVYAAGQSNSTVSGQISLWRLTAQDSLDTDFGVVTLGTGTAVDVDVLTDGGTLVTARHEGGNLSLSRVTESGAVDMSFGTSGSVDLGADQWCGTEVAPDGGAVICTLDSGYKNTLHRFNAAGQRDVIFGSGGDLLMSDRYLSDFAIDPQGRLLTIGIDTSGDFRSLLERYGANGTLEATLVEGHSGLVPAGWHSGFDQIRLMVQPNGRILVANASQPVLDESILGGFPFGFVIAAVHPETVAPPPPPTQGDQPTKGQTPRASRACIKARTGEKKARRVVKKTQRRVKKAKHATAKRRVRKQLKKKRAVLRKAKAKRIRACR